MKRLWELATAPTLALSVFFSMSATVAGVSENQHTAELPRNRASTGQFASTASPASRLVVLDVSATTWSGQPIANLKTDDFTLLEDGKKQKITVFRLQRSGASQGGTRNVIVVDAGRSLIKGQAAVRSQLIKYVKNTPIDDPMALFEYTWSEVQLLQGFTTDRSLLECAAEQLPAPEQKQKMKSGGPGNACSTLNSPTGTRQDIPDFVATLSAYPGRKNLIWIAEWPPSEALYSLSQRVLRQWPQAPDTLVPGTFHFADGQNSGAGQRPTEALFDSDWVVYPIEPERYTPEPPQPSLEDYDWIRRCARMICDDGSSSSGPREEEIASFHRKMKELANRTGGKAYYDRVNLVKEIRESIAAGSTYYVLGYYPEDSSSDGQLRHISIKVRNRKAKLRYRPSYVATD